MPYALPKDLQDYKKANSETELIELLLKQPMDLIQFLECACHDDEWCKAFPEFTKNVFGWVTTEFFFDRLTMEHAKDIAKLMREHSLIFSLYIPKDLTIKLKDQTIQINSLLLGSSCDYFRSRILKECRSSSQPILYFEEIPYEMFSHIEAFVNKGAANLWENTPNQLLSILQQAKDWGLDDLVLSCEDFFAPEVNRLNVFETLVMAHEKRLIALQETSISLINTLDLDVQFEQTTIDYLHITFLGFHFKAQDAFEQVKEIVTHITCGGNLIHDSYFTYIITNSPKLLFLDVSHSIRFSDRLIDIPSQVVELNLSMCQWLTDAYLYKMIEICPQLEKLYLGSNVQLSYAAWSGLEALKNLKYVDLSRCHQIGDNDFKIILLACARITSFHIEECKNISDVALFDIGKSLANLRELNVSRCNITDASLMEIAFDCSHLHRLNLAYCKEITDRGIVEAIRQMPTLTNLNIKNCEITYPAIKQIKKMNRFLKIYGP